MSLITTPYKRESLQIEHFATRMVFVTMSNIFISGPERKHIITLDNIQSQLHGLS